MRPCRHPLLAIATCAVLFGSTGASAQPAAHRDDERPPPADASEWRWYGWQTLIADGASLALVPVGVVGVLGFWFATPAVHAGHGRWGIAAASAAIRLGVTLVPAYLALSACFEVELDWNGGGDSGSGSSTACDLLRATAVAGLLVSVVLDAAAFAYDPPKPRDHAARMRFAPWARASAASTEAGLSVAGRF